MLILHSVHARMNMNHLVLLEHVNFKVPLQESEALIGDFFVRRLGAPECPTGRLLVARTRPGPGPRVPVGAAKQMHVNLGLSQIHFEWCTGDGVPYTVAQSLRGAVTLAVDDLDALRERLRDYPRWIRGGGGDEQQVVVVDPFGNTWICVQATSVMSGVLGRFAKEGIRPGGVGHVLGVLALDLDVRPGVARGIALFYRDLFHAEVRSLGWGGHEVVTRAGQRLRFNETVTAPPPNAYDVNPLYSLHMCVYIDDYETIARRALAQGLFWVNPDYVGPPINDHVSDVPGALSTGQFRVKQCGSSGWVFEHEIRSGSHRLCPPSLVGRLPSSSCSCSCSRI